MKKNEFGIGLICSQLVISIFLSITFWPEGIWIAVSLWCFISTCLGLVSILLEKRMAFLFFIILLAALISPPCFGPEVVRNYGPNSTGIIRNHNIIAFLTTLILGLLSFHFGRRCVVKKLS